jgi:hypothetical protein
MVPLKLFEDDLSQSQAQSQPPSESGHPAAHAALGSPKDNQQARSVKLGDKAVDSTLSANLWPDDQLIDTLPEFEPVSLDSLSDLLPNRDADGSQHCRDDGASRVARWMKRNLPEHRSAWPRGAR